MTQPPDDAARLALALDAFMAEHRRCWRLYGEGLDGGGDGAVLWVECQGCGSSLSIPLHG
jgi:hypothetical protein